MDALDLFIDEKQIIDSYKPLGLGLASSHLNVTTMARPDIRFDCPSARATFGDLLLRPWLHLKPANSTTIAASNQRL